jgi:hypothetical protein
MIGLGMLRMVKQLRNCDPDADVGADVALPAAPRGGPSRAALAEADSGDPEDDRRSARGSQAATTAHGQREGVSASRDHLREDHDRQARAARGRASDHVDPTAKYVSVTPLEFMTGLSTGGDEQDALVSAEDTNGAHELLLRIHRRLFSSSTSS